MANNKSKELNLKPIKIQSSGIRYDKRNKAFYADASTISLNNKHVHQKGSLSLLNENTRNVMGFTWVDTERNNEFEIESWVFVNRESKIRLIVFND